MAVQINLEYDDPITFSESIQGIDTIEELGLLFAGECYLQGSFVETCDPDGESEQILSAEWVDEAPPTSFHNYILNYMNNTDINQIMNIAEGNTDTHKYMTAITEYRQGFEEAVNTLINLDGLDFVFGNGFDLCTLFDFVVREILREYLREIDMF